MLSIHTFLILLLIPANLQASTNETVAVAEKSHGRKLIDSVRSIGSRQSVGVRGKLMCGSTPIKHVTVKLWDNDMLDPDDLLAEVLTNEDGTFEISGVAVSITAIDPQLRIYHNCLSRSLECKRKIIYTIPDGYINKGDKVINWFDFGVPNLEVGIHHKEEPHCV